MLGALVPGSGALGMLGTVGAVVLDQAALEALVELGAVVPDPASWEQQEQWSTTGLHWER